MIAIGKIVLRLRTALPRSAVANGTGVGISGGTLWLGNDVIIRNGTGVHSTGGTVLSYKTNMIDGNSPGGDGTPLSGIPLN